jgi:hypothetical protein
MRIGAGGDTGQLFGTKSFHLYTNKEFFTFELFNQHFHIFKTYNYEKTEKAIE